MVTNEIIFESCRVLEKLFLKYETAYASPGILEICKFCKIKYEKFCEKLCKFYKEVLRGDN